MAPASIIVGGDRSNRMIARLVTDLPEPEFANDSHGLAAVHRQRDAVHRGDRDIVDFETDAQAVNLKQSLLRSALRRG